MAMKRRGMSSPGSRETGLLRGGVAFHAGLECRAALSEMMARLRRGGEGRRRPQHGHSAASASACVGQGRSWTPVGGSSRPTSRWRRRDQPGLHRHCLWDRCGRHWGPPPWLWTAPAGGPRRASGPLAQRETGRGSLFWRRAAWHLGVSCGDCEVRGVLGRWMVRTWAWQAGRFELVHRECSRSWMHDRPDAQGG